MVKEKLIEFKSFANDERVIADGLVKSRFLCQTDKIFHFHEHSFDFIIDGDCLLIANDGSPSASYFSKVKNFLLAKLIETYCSYPIEFKRDKNFNVNYVCVGM